MSTARWRKSSRSGANYGCVETRRTLGRIYVRDSKDRHGPVLELRPAVFAAFLIAVVGGRHDRL